MQQATHARHLLLLDSPAVFLVDNERSQLIPHIDPVALYLHLRRCMKKGATKLQQIILTDFFNIICAQGHSAAAGELFLERLRGRIDV
jgi:hypothetical protein